MMAQQRYDMVLTRREPQQMTLDMLAAHAGMHPALVERFVECGLITPVEWQGDALLFDSSAVPRLCMIGRLRDALGINLAGVAVIMDLLDRFCALQRANETLRSRL
jgi:chaperone modulatory protein CbpM